MQKVTVTFLLLFLLNAALFARQNDEPTRYYSPLPSEFWQSKQGFAYIRKKQYNNKLTLKVRVGKELSEAQQALLVANGCDIVGYKGNHTYLITVPVQAVAWLHKLPFTAGIFDFDTKEKAVVGFADNIPQEVQQSAGEIWIDVLTVPKINPEDIASRLPAGAVLAHYYEQFNLARIKIGKKNINRLLEQPWVVWADYVIAHQPANQLGVTLSGTGALQSLSPQLTGKGVRVGVWDGSAHIGPHIDFVNRTFPQEPLMGESAGWRDHATHVSGTVAGAGLRFIDSRGIAPEATLFNYNIVSVPGSVEAFIPYKMIRAVEQHGIVITQNSYGPSHTCGSGGVNYSATNRAQDLVANAFPELLHVFSAGNSGNACGGFRNTVNGAKNIISVAGLNAADQRMWVPSQGAFSSAGPTLDGRMQPHIAALGVNVLSTLTNYIYGDNGWSGTSMAAPHVSGVAALLYQHYRQLNGGQNPPSALIRAVLLNGATDLGNPGPDYIFGFGKLNAVNAASAITENRFLTDAVSNGQSRTYNINVPYGSRELKIMLSWNDPAGLPGANPSLVNNLNLTAKSPSGNVVLPLVLNPAAPSAVAVQGVDNLNNNEQITVALPEDGNWEITVTGASVAVGNQQAFALTWQTEGEFLALRNPTTTERSLSPVTWDCRGIVGNVTVEFFDGASWTTLGTVPASQRQFAWTVPSIVTNNARIRISATGESGASHSQISPPLALISRTSMLPNAFTTPLVAGNNSLTVSWSPVTGAEAYEILRLNEQKGAWEVVATVPAPATTHTVTGLENGIRHWITVRPRNNTLNITGIYAYANFGTPTGTGPTKDIALVQVSRQTPPGGCFAPMLPQQVRISLRNQAASAIPVGTVIPVAYRISNGIWVNETFTLPTELNSGQTIDYTFTQTFTPTASEEITIEAAAQWVDDEVMTNNSRIVSLKVPDAPVPIVNAVPALAACTVPTMVSIAGVPDDDYSLQSIPFQPEDMSTATVISLTNDGTSEAIPLGFPFKFYNRLFEQVFISAEGFLTFRKVDFDYINYLPRAIPHPLIINDYVALAWNNMRFVTGSQIRYQTVGTAPERKFIVEFLDMAQENDHTKRVSGQIMLYESLNRIELHIARIDASPLTTIIAGIENYNGSAGIALPGMNNQSLGSDIIAQAWAFTPVATGFEWTDNNSNATARLITAAGNYTFRYVSNGCVVEQTITVCNNADVPHIAPVADVTTPEDTSVSVPVLITYGTQPETLLTISQTSDNPALIPDANLVWIGTGSGRQLQITPLPDQYGTAQITLTATDGVQTAMRTFQVIITPVNDAPVVQNFSINLFENAIHTFTSTPFTDHYTDVENEPMVSIKITALPLNGQLLWNLVPVTVGMVIPVAQIPQLQYRPPLNFTGTDTFQWTASDGTDFAALPATVTLRINKRPEPVLPIPTMDVIADVITPEDTPVTFPVRITYGELSDELLQIQIFTTDNTLLPRSAFRWTGSNANRRLTITPPANLFGEAEVTIAASNGRNTVVRRFRVRILPVNDAPVIRTQTVRVKSGQAFAFSRALFDAVYTDIENEPLAAVRIVQLPKRGQLLMGSLPIANVPFTIRADSISRLVYKPLQGFTGNDGLEWQASDGTDFSNIATVQIDVWNTPPQVFHLNRRIHWRQTLRFTNAEWAAAFSDADGDLPAFITISGNTMPQWRYNNSPIVSGAPLPLTDTTRISFQPERGHLGLQRFFWNASDGTQKAAQPAELTVLVWNTPPVATDFIAEGTGEVRLSRQLFASAYSDADGDPMERIRITALPQFGQLFWQGIPLNEATDLTAEQLDHLIYKPFNAAQPQPDRIGWVASDGAETSNTAFVHLRLAPLVNIVPQVSAFGKKGFENQLIRFTGEDFIRSYAYNNALPDFIRITALPFHGRLMIGNEVAETDKNYTLAQIAQLTYRPGTDFIGSDGFFFTAGSGGMFAPVPALVSLQIEIQPISAPENLQMTGGRISWQRPRQGNIKQYELQILSDNSPTLLFHTFVAEENFTLPVLPTERQWRVRVRAWGFHNNAGPFAEWQYRPEIVAANQEIIPSLPNLQVYPNPAAERVFVQWNRMPDAEFQLTDALGRIIAQWKTTAESDIQPLDIQHLSGGFYLLQVLFQGKRYTRTFVVAK